MLRFPSLSYMRFLAHPTFCQFHRMSAMKIEKNPTNTTHDVHYKNSLKRTPDKDVMTANAVPESADVVVIGGGSIGCSTAYHLAKLNIGKIVLIEKERLTSGTTWHTAGILWNLRGNRASIRMQSHTKELLSRILPEETGYDAGWIKTGSIFLTRSPDQIDVWEKISLMGSEIGVETKMLDVNEMSKLHPLLDTTNLIGGLYSPEDGSLDPATLCTSYVKAATKYGAQIIEKCEVKDIELEEEILGLKKVIAVETSLGRIKTNNVVNCAGAWAPYNAKMVRIKLPQLTYKHQYVVTQGICGIETTPHVRDLDKGIYIKRQGDALLFGGYERNMELVGGDGLVEKDFSFGLYDMDWKLFEVHMNSAIDIIPDVAKVGIRSTVCGPESFTPDGNALMGESPNVKGFFSGSGFNSGGMMLGGGAGKQLAHWVAYGQPEFDLSVCDINRFSSRYTPKYLKETCHELVVGRYKPPHPRKQPLAGRNLRISPLTEIHEKNGAFFISIHGWEVPEFFLPGHSLPVLDYDYLGSYGYKKNKDYKYKDIMDRDTKHSEDDNITKQIETETMAIQDTVAVVDLSHLSQFNISGPNANEAVSKLFTSDVTKSVNKPIETLMLNEEGKIVSNVNVIKWGDATYRVTAPSQLQEVILRHINQYLQKYKFECSFEDVTEDFAIFYILGPQSDKLLEKLTNHGKWNQPGRSVSKINNVDVEICQREPIKESVSCYKIQCRMDDVINIYKSLTSQHSDIHAMPVGLRALKSVIFGSDHHLNTSYVGYNPHSVELAHLCEMNDGREFVGMKEVEKLENIPSSLVKLTALSDAPILSSDCIWKDDIYIGTVAECVYDYNLKKYLIKGFITMSRTASQSADTSSSAKYKVGRRSHKVDAEIC